jgi:HAMP domain-containing protein
MTDWRHQLAELNRTEPDRELIRRRFDEGSRFPDPIEARREPRIAVITVAALIAIAGMAFLFVAFRNQPGVSSPAPAATGPASTMASAAPPCPITDSPLLGEAGVSFTTDCLAIVAHRPTTITVKAGHEPGDARLQHALLVCSDKDCNEASQLAGTSVKTSPALVVLNLPGLEPGTYFFEDPVHPATANGTLFVVDQT